MSSKGTGIHVVVKDGNWEKALKKFKKKVKDSNLMLLLADKQFYTKKSDKKREKLRRTITRNKYKMQELKNAENTSGK